MDQRDEFKLFIHNKKKAVGNPGEGPGWPPPHLWSKLRPEGPKKN